MFTFVIALLCFQGSLVQTVFGQITWCEDAYTRSPFDYAPACWAGLHDETFGRYGSGLYGPFDFGGSFSEPSIGDLSTGPAGPYGGAGEGEVAVAGELPAGGATVVAGNVPVLGAVEFAGPVRAAGTITIAGTCACGCAGPYIY